MLTAGTGGISGRPVDTNFTAGAPVKTAAPQKYEPAWKSMQWGPGTTQTDQTKAATKDWKAMCARTSGGTALTSVKAFFKPVSDAWNKGGFGNKLLAIGRAAVLGLAGAIHAISKLVGTPISVICGAFFLLTGGGADAFKLGATFGRVTTALTGTIVAPLMMLGGHPAYEAEKAIGDRTFIPDAGDGR